jgi:CheY-like chemotaxis protein
MTIEAGPTDSADLLRLLYAAPVGMAELDRDGLIMLANPLVMKLLLPIAGATNVSNLFECLEPFEPSLRETFTEFKAPEGLVFKDLRVQLPTGADTGGPITIALTGVKLNQARFVVTLMELADHSLNGSRISSEPSGDHPASIGDLAEEAPGTETELRDSVLIVDDEFLVSHGLAMQIEDMGLEVCAIAETAEEAEALAATLRPKLALIDVRLRGVKDGVDAGLAIRDRVGSAIIFITGSREQPALDRLAMLKPAEVLFKPVSGQSLSDAVRRVMES